jgi:hypothetical protein
MITIIIICSIFIVGIVIAVMFLKDASKVETPVQVVPEVKTVPKQYYSGGKVHRDFDPIAIAYSRKNHLARGMRKV